MAKSKFRTAPSVGAVRSRRAYFDCRYGQLHVRTAFPTTGGFDEQVTLVCLHPQQSSGRVFGRFLELAAAQRSVYAPDLPGCGESDPAPAAGSVEAAAAVADLASDLRLRQLDVLGLHSGAEVAIELALTRPDLVRALVLVGAVPTARIERLSRLARAPQVKSVDAAAFAAGELDGEAESLLACVDEFLGRLSVVSVR